jgi:soluble lytic murein transglycosylase-like protein
MFKKWLGKALLTSSFIIVQANAAEGPCKVFADYPETSAHPVTTKEKIVSEAIKHGIDPDFALSHAQLESNFNVKAVSSVGCIGLFQFLPLTAEAYCKTKEEKEKWRTDDQMQAILYGRIMAYLLNKYKGDYDLALLEYGGGPKAVKVYGKNKNLPYLKRIHKHICMKKLRRTMSAK